MSTHEGMPAAGGRRAAVRDREAAVETRLRALGTALDGEPDPAFREAARARLVAMAAVRSPAPEPRPLLHRLLATRDDARPGRRRGGLTAALTGAALAVTAVAALVAVASGARPGDLLYGIKRGTEQTQLALAGDSRGDTLLGFAHTRLTELGSLLQGGPPAQTVVATLRAMDEQTTEGAAWLTARAVATRSTGPVSDLGSWTRGQSAGLAALRPRLTAAAPAAADSAALLGRVAARAQAVSTALGCPSGPAVRGTDALGPVPVPCAAAIPAAPGAATGGGAPGGQQPPATVPVPGAPTVPPSGQPQPGSPADSGPGSGSVSGSSSGSGSGGPGGLLPPLGGGGTQTGAPSTPPLPLPLPLPGQSPAPSSGASPTTGASPTSGGGGIGLCLPPILTVGRC